jgi:hypothetical protein
MALEEGAAFIFSSWVLHCNGFGGFGSHVANPRELEASMPTYSHDIDELADNLGEIQIGSELESPFGLHIIATVYREVQQSTSLSELEKNLDDLFQLRLQHHLTP